jgi:hypothetical protein
MADADEQIVWTLDHLEKAGRTNLGHEGSANWGKGTDPVWKLPNAGDEAKSTRWQSDRYKTFAKGGIIRKPTILSDAATGTPYGLMAEAGPEAIVPQGKGGGTVQHVHSGTVIHKGVNSAGELVAAVKQDFGREISEGNRRIPNRVSIIPI